VQLIKVIAHAHKRLMVLWKLISCCPVHPNSCSSVLGVPPSEVKVSGSEVEILSFEIGVSGSEVEIPGFEVKISSFGVKVSSSILDVSRSEVKR
jgi:hypothetical protein